MIISHESDTGYISVYCYLNIEVLYNTGATN